jgi:ABC-2 family transporter protein
MLQLFKKIGEWNPQFTREIKGRLKLFPVLVTSAVSLIVQAVVFLAQLGQIPDQKYRMSEKYCGINSSYQEQLNNLSNTLRTLQNSFFHYSSKKHFDAEKLNQVKIQLEEAKNKRISIEKVLYHQPCPPGQIDMAEWWRDHWEYMFQALSVIFIITLLVAGSYLLISNLAQEENKGTLNFIRLSPQSEASILTGKMLGVPILVYLFIAVAIPFHIFSGKAAGIAFSHIFSYYALLAGSCVFFFSAALLFSLTTSALGGFQPWLGAGAVLMFLLFVFTEARYSSNYNHGAAWFRMLTPVDATSYLFPNFFGSYESDRWEKYRWLQFFYIPVGASSVSFIGMHLVHYGIWTYGIWQGLLRRFRNPNIPVISKQQSYFLVAFVQILLWGFTLQNPATFRSSLSHSVKSGISSYNINSRILHNSPIFAVFNFALLFSLIFILSRERQTIQDWARYRHTKNSNHKGWWHNSWLRDLVFGEKSVSLFAFGINLFMMVVPITTWLILYNKFQSNTDTLIPDRVKLKIILGLCLLATLWTIGATIAQRLLLLKTSKRYLWALGATSALLFAPAVILSILNNTIPKDSVLWLFSIHPWQALEATNLPVIFMAFFTQVIVLVFLNIRLTKQIKLAGESATQALKM